MGILIIDNIADLKTTTGATGDVAKVLGYYAAGDGGVNEFYWDSASTDTDNGGTVIEVIGVPTGRWLSTDDSGEVNIRQFGAIGDGTADDTAAIQAAVDTTKNVFIPEGQYKVTATVNLNVIDFFGGSRTAPKLRGENPILSVLFPVSVTGPVLKYEQTYDQLTRSNFGFGLEISNIGIIGDDYSRAVCDSAISVSGAWNPIFKNIKMRSLTGHGFVFPFDIRTPDVVINGTTMKNADWFSNGKAVFEQVFAENCTKWGFYFDTGNSSIVMSQSYAHNCKGGGMYILGPNNHINNCSFSYCGHLSDPASCGLQIGDDFLNNRTGTLRYSYPQVYNGIFSNLELDSSYNRNLVASGYLHTFKNIRVIQGSLTNINSPYFNAPVLIQLGIQNSPLFQSQFDGVVIRTTQNSLQADVFADTANSYCYNIDIKNVMNLFDQPSAAGHNGATHLGLTYFNFVNALSRNIVSEEAFNKFNFKRTPTNTTSLAPPTTGYWNVGDIIYNRAITKTSPSIGWICVEAGNPGTWNSLGVSYNVASANIGIGDAALAGVSTGIRNTALGNNAMAGMDTGTNNTAVGFRALGQSTAGLYNTAIGQDSMNNSPSGNANTGVGFESINKITVGGNTAVGFRALKENTSGSNNTAIGVNAARLVTGGANTYIGTFDGTGAETDSNRIVLSDGAGNVRIFTDSTGRLGLGAIGTLTDKLQFNGNLNLSTAGNKLKIATGSNASVGTATLVAGTVTIATTAVTSNSLIFLTYNTPGGTLAAGLSAPAASIVNGTSFVINSLSAAGAVNTADTSSVRWWIIN